MTEKLAAWRQEKGRHSKNRRPLAAGQIQKKLASAANDENCASPNPNSSRKAGKNNKFGWKSNKKPTPSKLAKRKVEDDGRRVLTPVQKKSCTPVSRKASSMTMTEIVAKLEPWTNNALTLVDKKVCKGLRHHELVKRVKKLQAHVLDMRKSYSEYVGQVKALLELCVERERVLANDSEEVQEQNTALRAAREDLEHTIYTLREENKTYVRNITEMIDAKKELKNENNGLNAKANVLAEKLKESVAGNDAAQAQLEQMTSDLNASRAAFDALQGELQQVKDECASEIARYKVEQETKRQAAQEAMDATVRDVREQLSAETTKTKVLEAQRNSLEAQVAKLEASGAEVAKAKEDLQVKVNELTLSDVRQTTQIEGLKMSVDQLKTALEQKESMHEKNMAHFEKMLNQNENRAARSDSEKDALNEKLSALRAAHSQLEASSRNLETKCASLEGQLADAVSRGETSATELAASLEQLETQQEQLSKLEETHNNVVREFEAAQTKFQEAKLAWEDSHSMLTAQVAEGKATEAKLQAELKTTEHALVSKTAELDATEKQLSKLETTVKSWEENNPKDKQDMIAKFSEMLSKHQEMSKQLHNQDTIVRDYEASQREVARLQKLLMESETSRRKLHNRVQELRGNIRVFVRVRPFLPSDGDEYKTKEASLKCLADGQAVHVGDKPEHQFSFDRVFRRNSSQESVFGEVSELVQSALDGYNVCIFSYGQTGSGKTYTMQGFPADPAQRGLIPRSMEQILETAERMKEQGWQFEFKASFVEIYNEQVRDLLRTSDAGANCDIKRDARGKTFVSGSERMEMRTMSDVGDIMRLAAEKRAVGCTAMNSVSSRSHSVFTIFMTGTCERASKKIAGQLNLCDLAGSERLARSQAQGAALKETQAINKSLSALANVFMALKAKQAHIPYRNSKLTYMLEPCFSKDGKTMMLVNVSPTMLSQHETTCSLRFAAQVNQCELGKATAQVSDLKTKTPGTSNGAGKSTSRSISRLARPKASKIAKRARK
eukprot:INCI18678.1.p1 GENE.INCI18678.1~~INCI18678.1.p1  ORF type:complete len:1065 (-),score=275.99 INCI18678.1:90-3122(-)